MRLFLFFSLTFCIQSFAQINIPSEMREDKFQNLRRSWDNSNFRSENFFNHLNREVSAELNCYYVYRERYKNAKAWGRNSYDFEELSLSKLLNLFENLRASPASEWIRSIKLSSNPNHEFIFKASQISRSVTNSNRAGKYKTYYGVCYFPENAECLD